MKKALVKLIKERAHHCREYCLLPESESPIPFQIDHILAEQHVGKTSEENLAYSCAHCNRYKGTNIGSVDPDRVTDHFVPLFNPRKDLWNDHFRFEGLLIVGKTPSGRATAFILQFNNSNMKRVRAKLLEEGVYPPPHYQP